MKKEIVFFIGCIGSGKDYQCSLLEQQGYKRVAFADTLRELAWRILDYTPKDDACYDRFKKQTITGMTYASPYEQHKYKIELTGREFLQRLGTEARNLIDEDIWLKALRKRIQESDATKFCVSDLRFENEFEFAKKLDGKFNVKIIFTDYRSQRYNSTDTHASEQLAQKFLSEGKHDLQILYASYTPKIGDYIMLREHKGLNDIKYPRQPATILEIDPYSAYPYTVVINDGSELSITRDEFEAIYD